MTMRNDLPMLNQSEPTSRSYNASSLLLGLGPLIVLILLLWFAGWTGNDQTGSAADAAWVLSHAIVWPALWLCAAAGFGWPLRLLLAKNSRDGVALQIALGVALMLMIDETLGLIGFLQFRANIGAWLVIVLGLGLLAIQAFQSIKVRPKIEPPHWLVWMASPSIAVLFLAACSAPGWLWSTEFGGYDALSYHLQLPKEWLGLGRIEPLNHNVYSYFPGYIEAAYYHLGVLIGDGIASVYTCQLLHVMLTIIAALLIGRVAWRIATAHQSLAATSFDARIIGVIATVIALGTPWVIVVGSLGYNEMSAVMMLAAGMLAIMDDSISPIGRGALVGLLAATACAAKLTALGLVAAPLGILLLVNLPARDWWKAIIVGGIAGLVILLPWLIRNQLYAHNPVFPFMTAALGLGHWTSEQATTFAHGHRADVNPIERLAALWNQFLRYGIGPNPLGDEPWKPQWSILPWSGMLGLVVGLTSKPHRKWSGCLLIVLAVQLLFWLFFTHLKSRFLLPAVMPLSIGTAIGVAVAFDRWPSLRSAKLTTALIGLALLAWSSVPVFIYHGEQGGGPSAGVDMAARFAGDDLPGETRAKWAQVFPMVLLNYGLPPDAKVLLVGDATPLYARDQKRVVYQTTWDRGPLSQIMRDHPDDPATWIAALRDEGFTHLLIDPNMLHRWEIAGWNDPLITATRVMNMANHAALVRRFPSGEAMYQLNRKN